MSCGFSLGRVGSVRLGLVWYGFGFFFFPGSVCEMVLRACSSWPLGRLLGRLPSNGGLRGQKSHADTGFCPGLFAARLASWVFVSFFRL